MDECGSLHGALRGHHDVYGLVSSMVGERKISFSDRGSSWNGLSGRCRISGGGIGGSLVFPFDCRRVNSKAQCKTHLVADASFSVGDGGFCV